MQEARCGIKDRDYIWKRDRETYRERYVTKYLTPIIKYMIESAQKDFKDRKNGNEWVKGNHEKTKERPVRKIRKTIKRKVERDIRGWQ